MTQLTQQQAADLFQKLELETDPVTESFVWAKLSLRTINEDKSISKILHIGVSFLKENKPEFIASLEIGNLSLSIVSWQIVKSIEVLEELLTGNRIIAYILKNRSL